MESFFPFHNEVSVAPELTLWDDASLNERKDINVHKLPHQKLETTESTSTDNESYTQNPSDPNFDPTVFTD